MKKFSALFLLASSVLYSIDYSLIDSPFPGHKIEIAVQKPSNEPSPLIIVLHGAQGDGVRSIRSSWFDHWTDKGYTVVAISMAGYGESTGKKDFCGPFTIDSLHYAIDVVKKDLNTRFGLFGFGQGGNAALLLASQRNDINCLVCSNGGYDFRRHTDSDNMLRQVIEKKGYDLNMDDTEAVAYRSTILHIDTIRTPVFLLHREHNPMIPEQEVIDFQTAMLQAGKECHLAIEPKTPEDDAQKLNAKEILGETEVWFDNLMQSK